MKTMIALAAVGCLFGTVTSASAQANCAQVNRYLSTGRTVQDVAETMVLSEDEVKKCQEEAKKAPPSGGAAGATGATGGGATQPGGTSK